jgi:FolB domain-containing protein
MTFEDQIQIRDLMIRGIIGTTERERTAPQDIRINLTLFVDLKRAGESDRVEDTVNYSKVTRAIIDYVEKAKRFTVEALATDIAKLCFEFDGVRKLRVRVEKPGLYSFAQSVGIEIERERSHFH